VFGANGRYKTETFQIGDVGFVPQGYGHSLENTGDKVARVLIGFNSGIYEDIDLTEWIAANPPDVLATNFGKPAALFNKFPHRDVFIAGKEGASK
jgi:oxalate decarboxylase